MEKTSLVLIFKEKFEKEEDCCIILHFYDGSEIIVKKLPSFFNLHMVVFLEYNGIVEECMIPYSSVLYFTVTSNMNLKKIYDNGGFLNE